MSLIRSAGLRGFRAAVAELGGDAEELATMAGLPVAALDGDDILVPDLVIAGVLEIAARELGCPDLGLRIAARQDLGMLGPLAAAIQNAPNLGEALACTSRYLFLHARTIRVALRPDPQGVPGIAAIEYSLTTGLRPPVQGTDLSLGFLHRAINELAGENYGLRSVELPYRPRAPIATYEEFFGATIRTDRPTALMRLPERLASQPIRSGGDENLHRLALSLLIAQSAHVDDLAAPRVAAALEQLLGTTRCDIASVGRLLNLHPRTLQRRLISENTSFAELLDEARRIKAKYYLTSSTLPMSQISSLLGLSEQSALSRCSQRWWRASPSAVRRNPELTD